jgi:uncharacterized protein (TIGR03083 family)
LDLGIPADDAALAPWLTAGAVELLARLRAADPDAPMWAWGSDQHARFWPRRMLHETAVHRADAEIAAGAEPVLDAVVAVDGIDELLDNLPCAVYFAPAVAALKGEGERLVFSAEDAGVVWSIRLQPDGFQWDHADGDAAARVSGSASDLALVLNHRLPAERVTVEGDPALWERWRENSSY